MEKLNLKGILSMGCGVATGFSTRKVENLKAINSTSVC
jgi:hypothetical protein